MNKTSGIINSPIRRKIRMRIFKCVYVFVIFGDNAVVLKYSYIIIVKKYLHVYILYVSTVFENQIYTFIYTQFDSAKNTYSI